MEFYTLLDVKKGKELAQIVEFDDGQVVVKWYSKVNGLIIHKNLEEFKLLSLKNYRNRALLHESVKESVEYELDKEQIQKSMDILYSA